MFTFTPTDFSGSIQDLQFLKNGHWLSETAIVPKVYGIHGRWKIKICFIWLKHPHRMIIKYIQDDYHTQEKATLFANFYIKSINKDSLEKSIINQNDYTICNN